MDRVIFHIGSPKTGTSIIQSHLAQNRSVLRDKGYLYPITISSDRTIYRTFESHHLLTYSWADWKPFNRYEPARFFEMAEKTAVRHGIHTLLLSAENTYWLPRQLMGREVPDEDAYWSEKQQYVERIARDLRRFAQCRIIVYLRRQDRWIESWLNQQVKNGNAVTEDVERFVEQCRYLLDYERVLALWAQAFGEDALIVRAYEKEQLEHGLFADFCSAIGLEDASDLPLRKKPRYNAQLDRDALEFLNICNGLNLSAEQRWWLRITLRRVTRQFERQLVFQEQSLLSPVQRATLAREYADMNRRIAQRYLGRAEGRLFYEPDPSPEARWDPYPGLSSTKAVELTMQMLMELQYEIAVRKAWNVRAMRALRWLGERLVPDAVQRGVTSWRDRIFWRRHIWDHQE